MTGPMTVVRPGPEPHVVPRERRRADLVAALAAAVAGRVAVRSAADHQGSVAGRLTVVVDPRWNADLSAMAVPVGPVLPVHGVCGRLVVGPLVEPGRSGCPHCVALRAWAAGRSAGVAPGAVPETRPLSGRAVPWWPASLVPVVAAALLGEADRIDTRTRPSTRDSVLVLDVRGPVAQWHPVVPHVFCDSPVCRAARRSVPPPLPDLHRRLPTATPAGSRRFGLSHYRDTVTETHLDPWSGVVIEPAMASNAALPAVQAKAPTRWGFDEVAIGHADNYADATTAAVLEGLERYAGWHCGGRPPARVGAFAELDDAVDPRLLLTHEDEAYRHPGFEYVPFDPHLPVSWARAHSLHTGREMLLPYHIAYYGATRDAALGPSFVYENSNGCAIGAGPEEAVLAALLEVVERDAFLRAWYSATPLPELDLDDTNEDDPTGSTALAVRTLRRRTGRRLRAFRAVGEFGLPVVLLVTLSDEPDQPATLITAGCGLDTVAALRGAVHEMATAAPALAVHYRRRAAELTVMLDHPEQVRTMTDHALLGALPAARERFDFLLRPALTPAPVAPDHVPRGDVAADLAALLAAADRAGYQVLVVDHTTPELHRADLTCVKVVLPGTAPMTFGHLHRRMPGVDSLNAFRRRHHTPPVQEVRHDPHPFP